MLRHSTKLKDFILLVYWLGALFLALWRVKYGIELTDEAIYIAGSYVYIKGALPFSDIWSHVASSVFTYAIVTKLWVALSGGTEGIFLLMRISYTIWKFCIIVVCAKLLCRKFDSLSVSLFLVPLIIFSPFNIYQFSYNTVPASLLLLIGVMLAIRDSFDKRKESMCCFVAGALMAICVLGSASLVFVGLGIGVILLVESRKNFAQYILGGAIITIFVMGYLFLWSNPQKVFRGLYEILYNGAYLQIKHTNLQYDFTIFKQLLYPLLHFALFTLVMQMFLLLYCRFNKQKNYKNVAKRAECLFLFSYLILVLLQSITGEKHTFYTSFVMKLWFIPIVIYIMIHTKAYAKLMMFLYIPNIIYYFGVGITSWTGLATRDYILVPTAVFTVLMLETVINNSFPRLIKIKNCMTIMVGICILSGTIKENIEYVYRDAAIHELNTIVESGIYKGIYTTENNSISVVLLEDYVKNITNEGEKILFLDHVPFAYLMSKGEFYSPTTMDPMLYSYHINDTQLLMNYFDQRGDIPDKIIYIWTGRDAILSIEDEGVPFNEFVNRNYNLCEAVEIGSFRVTYYVRSEDGSSI